MPRDGSDVPPPGRPQQPEPQPVTVDQVRLDYARRQISLAHDRERDLAVEIVVLAELREASDKRIAELEAQLAGMCAELEAKNARIAELEWMPFDPPALVEPVAGGE